MALSTKITPFQRTRKLVLDRALSPKERSQRLAAFARERLAEAQKVNKAALGHEPPYETFVDQKHGAPLESVRPDGVIVFEFDLVNNALAWIGEQLVLHAPVLTGRYRDTFAFFADEKPVAPGAALPPAREYLFISPMPYARKIERGQSDQAPTGVFQAVATLAKGKFGNLADIKFTFRSFEGGAILPYVPAGVRPGRGRSGRFVSGASGADRADRQREMLLRQPAIVVYPR